jgi:hypothetical protein
LTLRAFLGVSSSHRVLQFLKWYIHSSISLGDKQFSPYWAYIRRIISTGLTPSANKNRITPRISSLVQIDNGASIFNGTMTP